MSGKFGIMNDPIRRSIKCQRTENCVENNIDDIEHTRRYREIVNSEYSLNVQRYRSFGLKIINTPDWFGVQFYSDDQTSPVQNSRLHFGPVANKNEKERQWRHHTTM